MAKPKYDYNGDAFYDEILALSIQGLLKCGIDRIKLLVSTNF